jgi:hypothetical protein
MSPQLYAAINLTPRATSAAIARAVFWALRQSAVVEAEARWQWYAEVRIGREPSGQSVSLAVDECVGRVDEERADAVIQTLLILLTKQIRNDWVEKALGLTAPGPCGDQRRAT